MLVFAKPMEPKIASADLNKLLERAVSLCEKIIQDKQIDIKLESQQIPMVNVDVAMITDAFVNVIRNAVEAMENNGHIRIYARSIGSQPPSVLVVVEDDGCGIDDADMPHLFNPFFTKKNMVRGWDFHRY